MLSFFPPEVPARAVVCVGGCLIVSSTVPYVEFLLSFIPSLLSVVPLRDTLFYLPLFDHHLFRLMVFPEDNHPIDRPASEADHWLAIADWINTH